LMVTCLTRRVGEASSGRALASGVKRRGSDPGRRPAPGTVAGGEFDWGGTPVKLKRRCPKGELVEDRNLPWSRRAKARLILIFSMNTDRETSRSFWLFGF